MARVGVRSSDSTSLRVLRSKFPIIDSSSSSGLRRPSRRDVKEPDVSIETGSTIRVAVLPVGGPIPHSLLRSYVAMLGRHARIDLSSTSSFYSEHQKSPFTHQPWETGSISFKLLLGGSPASPWEDFQSCRKILAVIGLCHCPAPPDLGLVADQFATACKGYSSALAKRCFVFCPSDSQVTWNLVCCEKSAN